jgi:hypothetical protein
MSEEEDYSPHKEDDRMDAESLSQQALQDICDEAVEHID